MTCLEKKHDRNLVQNVGSTRSGWIEMRKYYLPLSDSQIRKHEHVLKSLKMKQGEDPHVFFTAVNETVGVLNMLDVKKDEREICPLMLDGLTSDYAFLKEACAFCPRLECD